MADGHRFFNMEDDIASCNGDDFDEEHVWNVLVDKKDQTVKAMKLLKEPPAFSRPRYLPTAAKMIISKSQNSSGERTNIVAQSSAPVNIPNWSKIYLNKNVGESNIQGFHGVSQEEDDFEDDDDERIPPHEWIAKKVARNQISSFSMCEGMGRTLKGRDLSKVRNTVLTRTGFLE